MVKLSVNINKIATLRNARGGNTPNLLEMAHDIQLFGADGITIHPRPDQRHITYNDAKKLPSVVNKEYNIVELLNNKSLDLFNDSIFVSDDFNFIRNVKIIFCF